MDWRVLYTADRIRERYGKPVRVNNWHYVKRGHIYRYRGFRPYALIGAALSQHCFGRGLDGDVEDVSAEEVRQDILKNPDCENFKYITALELGVNWLHFDCRGHDKSKGIFTFHQ